MKRGRILCRAAHKVGLSGNVGLTAVTTAVCQEWKRPLPQTRRLYWVLLREFIGETSFIPNTPPWKKKKYSSPRAPLPVVATDDFLVTYEWRKLRMQVLTKRGARCECCGATPIDGIRIHVDHIKPRRLFPELALVESNLQVLCEVCNHGKGNWDHTDWRLRQIDHVPIHLESEDRDCAIRLIKG